MALKPLTRIGFNINGADFGDEAILLHHLTQWRPAGVTLVGGWSQGDNVVRRIADLMAKWGGIVVYRPFQGDAVEKYLHNKYSPQEYIDRILKPLDFQRENIWLNVGNEPPIDGAGTQGKANEARKIAKWYAQLVNLALAQGLKVVVLNGIAIEHSEVESGWLDELLIALGQNVHNRAYGYSKAMIGAHPYTMLTAALAVGGGAKDGNPEGRVRIGGWVGNATKFDVIGNIRNFSTQAEVLENPNNYIMWYRYRWLTDRANGLFNAGMWGTNTYAPINVFGTEFGYDDMPHVYASFKKEMEAAQQINGGKFKGIKTLKGYKAAQFAGAGWNAARGFCEELLYADDLFTSEVVALATWAWNRNKGNDGLGNWYEKDDISEYTEFLDLYSVLAKARKGETTPPPVPPPVEPPPPTPPDPDPAPADNAAAIAALEHALGALAVAKAAIAGAESVVSEQIGKLKA